METLYDDRPVSAGVQFSDADLLGVPFRVVVSPRNLREGCCEIAARDHSFTQRSLWRNGRPSAWLDIKKRKGRNAASRENP